MFMCQENNTKGLTIDDSGQDNSGKVHLGQLSLLPSAGREMSACQSKVMLCGWGVKVGMVHSTCG